MSVSEISGRVAEIQQMITSLRTGAPAQATSGTDFAQALQGATTATPAAAATATAPATTASGTLSTPYASEIQAAAQKHGLDPALLAGLIRQESNFNPAATSPAGAKGLTQLMPGTAASLGVTDPTDPRQAIEGGATYLKQQLDAFGGDERKALAAYNAGPGAVQRFGGVPPYAETQAYVQKVLAYAEQYRASAPAPTPTVLPTTPAAAVTTTSLSTPTDSSPAGGLSYPTT